MSSGLRPERREEPKEGPEAPERKTPLEQMEAFYELQNGQPMSEEQRAFMERLMEEIREVDV